MGRLRYVVLAAILCATQGAAQDISFDAGDADDDLKDLLREASLTLSLDEDADTAAQDYVAAPVPIIAGC